MEDALADFKIWYFSKPLFTRTYLAICTAVTLLITLKLLSPMTILYTFKNAFLHFQIWRPFSALFFMGKFDFSFLFNIYFAYIAIHKV